MTPLSAVDAIEPAWRHTWRLLVAPRNWRTLFKIAAVAFFAEVGGCNANYRSGLGHAPHLPAGVAAAIAGLIVLIALVAVIVGLGFFYLSSRLQLVLFDLLLRSDTVVAPGWNRFGGLVWRWIGIKLLFTLAFLLACLPIVVPIAVHFIHNMPKDSSAGPAHIGSFFALLFGMLATLFLLLIVFSIGYTLLRDFGIPSLALENTTVAVTVRRILHFLRAEPGQVLLYLVMRFVLGIAGAICGYLILILGSLVALIPFGGAAVLFWAALRHAGPTGHILMVAGWVVCGLLFAALVVIAVITIFGYFIAFLQAYALYFLGGRYPLVGAQLDAALQPPSVYAYPYPYPPQAPYGSAPQPTAYPVSEAPYQPPPAPPGNAPPAVAPAPPGPPAEQIDDPSPS